MDHSHATFTPADAASAAEGTLGERLAAHYAQRIGQRLLQPGARLPSVRDCARAHGVSPSTVVAAYDRLQAHGLVEARRQRGFFVRPSTHAPAARLHHEPNLALPAPVDAAALIRAMFRTRASLPGPGLGTLPETWLDPSLLQRALRRAMTDGDDALRYGEPSGDPALRGALARRLSSELGIACDPSQIVTAVGATHALDIVARTLLKPGDAVLVDDPGWAVEHARLIRLGMRLLPVPRGPAGPDLQVMRELILLHRPRLYVTVSVLHNPTGATLSLAAAHQVLQLAEAHDLIVVEDDTYAWLAPSHAPRLAALDGLQRTVYVTGFSKILAPNWRVGALAAPRALVERIVDTKLLSSLTTPAVLERARRMVSRAGPAAPPCRARDGAPGRRTHARGPAGAGSGVQDGRRAAGLVRLGRHRRRHRGAGRAHGGRGLAARTGPVVPRAGARQHFDADQLRQLAGRALLARLRTGQRCAASTRHIQRFTRKPGIRLVTFVSNRPMFQSTLPLGEPDLMRVSAFQRYLDDLVRVGSVDATSTRLSSLSPSLMQDLERFERDGKQSELLDVLAACLRHGYPLTVNLQWTDRVVPLTLFPAERLVHCPVSMPQFLSSRLSELQVLQVEPAMLRAPGHREQALVGEVQLYSPLAPLLWEMSLRGSRERLLPEIAGTAAYRVAPGVNLRGLEMPSILGAAVDRLRRRTCNLREVAEWPGLDRERAMRLLNALYLQGGLIVSRMHPSASSPDGWLRSRTTRI